MLTGRVPYDGDRPVEVAWQHVDRDVPPPSSIVPGLPPVLDELVARATRRDPGARPPTPARCSAEVQVVRDDLGNANADTALLRQVSGADHDDGRGRHRTSAPAWARLPGQAAEPPRPGAAARRSPGRRPPRTGRGARLGAGYRR